MKQINLEMGFCRNDKKKKAFFLLLPCILLLLGKNEVPFFKAQFTFWLESFKHKANFATIVYFPKAKPPVCLVRVRENYENLHIYLKKLQQRHHCWNP